MSFKTILVSNWMVYKIYTQVILMLSFFHVSELPWNFLSQIRPETTGNAPRGSTSGRPALTLTRRSAVRRLSRKREESALFASRNLSTDRPITRVWRLNYPFTLIWLFRLLERLVSRSVPHSVACLWTCRSSKHRGCSAEQNLGTCVHACNRHQRTWPPDKWKWLVRTLI